MMRLTEWTLQFPEDVHVHPSMGSVFHGALMDAVAPDVAEALHALSLRPYSQYVYWDSKRHQAVWRIGTLTDSAYEAIVDAVPTGSELFLKQKGYAVGLSDKTVIRETSFEVLAQTFIAEGMPPAGAIWLNRTVTSFKQNGRYVIMPDMNLVYGSLIRRWNAFSSKVRWEDPALSTQLTNHCRLLQYQLESRTYPLEGTHIYGYQGKQRYGFFGFDMLKRVQGMLTEFAKFSGIGVKTALGMGAVETQVIYKEAV